MQDQNEICRQIIAAALNEFIAQKKIESETISAGSIRIENPPKPEMGDIGSPMFMFARTLRMAPPVIAGEAERIINSPQGTGNFSAEQIAGIGTFRAEGPYINVRLNKQNAVSSIIRKILAQGEDFGSLGEDGTKPLAQSHVMVEYSSPNTNKPLHLGHMRNDALGESVSRILRKAGADVFRTIIVNDRGIHICKSMLAYKLFHEKNGDTPQSLGMKGDHFVGQCYVEFDRYLKGDPEKNIPPHPEAQAMAEEMLVKWEQGDSETRSLWQRMNGWTMDGVRQTYMRTGVGFEKYYFESETYLLGKEVIEAGLEKGIFFKADDGSVRIDVTEAAGPGKDGGRQEKVLLRKDGTSVYITQDLGTAIKRHQDWSYNQMVYVVASEQNYHFKVLFYILRKLGYEWAQKLFHLSYGMVNLPTGRMKSREGTVVDADDLIDSLHQDALKAINERGRDEAVGDADDVAEKVALSALHYYLLQVSPAKDMVFNPEESLSFTGNTGPYLQYMGARISSILRKAEEAGIAEDTSDQALSLLTHESEWELIKSLDRYPQIVLKAAQDLDPSVIAVHLYEVSKNFSAFYRDCPITSLGAEDRMLSGARLALARCTLIVIKDAMSLLVLPFLERM